MTITFEYLVDKHACVDVRDFEDLRGMIFVNTVFKNYEERDFSGCVLYRCYAPEIGEESIHVEPLRSINDISLKDIGFARKNFDAAYLKGANLQDVDFFKVSLHLADLSGANLSGADLQSTYLRNADLSGANLEGANLEEAYLSLIHI